jgi:hypothetical protein
MKEINNNQQGDLLMSMQMHMTNMCRLLESAIDIAKTIFAFRFLLFKNVRIFLSFIFDYLFNRLILDISKSSIYQFW